jgi:hypothetical protein
VTHPAKPPCAGAELGHRRIAAGCVEPWEVAREDQPDQLGEWTHILDFDRAAADHGDTEQPPAARLTGLLSLEAAEHAAP